jgi:hydroxymethylpyrimidine/phosphomethylpyrimidine kinase
MKTLLIASGLDPTGGAGFLCDVRVAADHGLRAVGVVTALTVQDTRGVRSSVPCCAKTVGEALATLLLDVEVDAVKIGMLGDDRIAEALGAGLMATRAPIVWDPVLLPSRGEVPLFRGDLVATAARLLPRVRVVTPNLAEAAALTGRSEPIVDVAGMRRAASALRDRGAAVLIKGGHLPSGPAVDLLFEEDSVRELRGKRLEVGEVHGTGCVLSTALACGLALGKSLGEAAESAKSYLATRLAALRTVGHGARCLV